MTRLSRHTAPIPRGYAAQAPSSSHRRGGTNPERAKKTNEVPLAVLRQLFNYNPITGKLTWKHRPVSFFKNERDWRLWNAKHEDKDAMSADGQGYKSGKVLGVKLKAHRVAYALGHGQWPKGQVDHIDGNRSNNALSNLRQASPSLNSRNRGITDASKSGQVGVYHRKRNGKWEARITVDGRERFIGEFTSREEAVLARKNAEIVFGFHANHGNRDAVKRGGNMRSPCARPASLSPIGGGDQRCSEGETPTAAMREGIKGSLSPYFLPLSCECLPGSGTSAA